MGTLVRWSLDFGRPLTYAWTGPSGFTSALAAPVATPPGAGTHTYRVTVSDPATGCSFAVSTTVQVVQLAVVSLTATPAALCAPTDVARLQPTVSGGPVTSRKSVRPVFIHPYYDPTSTEILVSGLPASLPATAGAVQVEVSLQFQSMQYLVLSLIAPSGRQVTLVNYQNISGNEMLRARFSDLAPTAIGSGTAPYTGTFRPTGALTLFGGEDPNGTWRLEVACLTNLTPFNPGGVLDGARLILDGTIYQWTGPNGFTANQPALDVSPPLAGANPYTLTVRYGACSTTRTVSVDVQRPAPAPTASPDGICALTGGTIQLRANAPTVDKRAANATIIPIPDNAGSARSAVVLSGLITALPAATDVAVTVDVRHSMSSELTLTLIAPDGTRVLLANRIGIGFGSGVGYLNTVFSDGAAVPITGGTPPYSGVFRPEQALATTLAGRNPNGTWQLEVTDRAAGRVGSIRSWSLRLTRATYAWTGPLGFTSALADPVAFIAPATQFVPATYAVRVTDGLSVGGCASPAAPLVVAVETVSQWTGAVSDSWYDAGNWTRCVPGPLVSATIPDGLSRYPIIRNGTAQAAGLVVYGELQQLGGTLEVGNSIFNFSGRPLRLTGGTVRAVGSNNFRLYQVTEISTLVVALQNAYAFLDHDLLISTALTLVSGDFHTAGQTLTLGPTATLTESAAHYLLGRVITTRAMTNIVGNPETFGNIGLSLRSWPGHLPTPGLTTVARTTDAAPDGPSFQGIRRVFDIEPATNAGLRVAATFSYAPRELAGLPTTVTESALTVFKAETAAGPWAVQGFTTRDGAARTVTLANIVDFSLWTLGNDFTPLPVELTRFAVRALGPDARLTWATASEKNNAWFEVEVSTDGRTFRPIGRVAGHGTTPQPHEYAFTDPAVARYGAPLLYYRLAQADTDGTVTRSDQRTLRVTAAPGPLTVTLAPNPVGAGGAAVQLQGPQPGPAVLVVTDAVGRVVLHRAPTLLAGATEIALPELGTLPPGVYHLHVVQGGQTATTRVVRQ